MQATLLTPAAPRKVQVVAALLRDPRGRVLIAQRPDGKPLAGYWEFPGGKREPGEAAFTALRRELEEELGIALEHAHRLLQISHAYPELTVDLDVWRVVRFSGEPIAREGQRLSWVTADELADVNLLPADIPIVAALKLPPLMLVTPDAGDRQSFLAGLRSSLEAGVDFVQFRAPGRLPDAYTSLAREVIALCHRSGTRIHLNAEPGLARELGADGVHLSQSALARHTLEGMDRRLTIGVSCHDAGEMARALAFRPDYLTLGTVQASESHPGVVPIGWERFQELVNGSPVPIYAIGGLGYRDLPEAQRRGAHGIAAIRGLWGGIQSLPSS